MKIRLLRHSDLEPLHQLYLSLTSRMPPHPSVGMEQFANELTTTRFQEDEHWDEGAHLTLVAEKASTPIALIHASFLAQDARYTPLKAGTGIIRSLYASPEESSALNTLLQIAVEAAKQHDCQNLQAFSAYAPLFHNCGASGLSNALPWIGRALIQERFETQGFPALAMYCPLNRLNFARLPLPVGSELRHDWVTRIGERDKTEGGFHLFIGDARAAETMWHFGEKYVHGTGNAHAHLFWLGTNPPYRGQGLGRLLLRETLVRMQELGAQGSDLRCNINNFYAHALYRAEGYEPTDVLWSFKQASSQR